MLRDSAVHRTKVCALSLVKDVVAVSDICHIYDNSEEKPFRIKKRKEECFFEECEDWCKEDIKALTDVQEMERKELN